MGNDNFKLLFQTFIFQFVIILFLLLKKMKLNSSFVGFCIARITVTPFLIRGLHPLTPRQDPGSVGGASANSLARRKSGSEDFF